jgi:hypothetical protein
MGIGIDLRGAAMESAIVAGVGPDAPTVVGANGGKQSHSPYRCDLLPPRALLHLAAILKEGADKYGDENWRLIPFADHINHAMTHILAHKAGDTTDDHIGHALCRMMFAFETMPTQPTA